MSCWNRTRDDDGPTGLPDAKERLTWAKTDKDRNFYEGKCDHWDRQIGALVYELYGLTAEAIRMVEEGTS